MRPITTVVVREAPAGASGAVSALVVAAFAAVSGAADVVAGAVAVIGEAAEVGGGAGASLVVAAV
jgi:hypothetical protein